MQSQSFDIHLSSDLPKPNCIRRSQIKSLIKDKHLLNRRMGRHSEMGHDT